VVTRIHSGETFGQQKPFGQITGVEMRAPSRNYQDSLIEALRDPSEAAAYLDAALEEGDRAVFLVAIRNVIRALGGMTHIAREAGLNRENLYRVLSEQGNPELASLEKLLKSLGLRLSVEVDQDLNHAA
jgi:probable addiction module antidote protein